MRMQAGQHEQGSIYWWLESRSTGIVHTPLAGIYEYCRGNITLDVLAEGLIRGAIAMRLACRG